ncbi:hypothetical protein GCM10028794_28700 [Silanimonas algicola]
MSFRDLEAKALRFNELYEILEAKKYGRTWTTQELMLGVVGDVGDLAKLVQATSGPRSIDDHKAKIGHERADCLWSILVIARTLEIDIEAEFVRSVEGISGHVAGQIDR